MTERVVTEQEPQSLVDRIAFLPWGEWSGWATSKLVPLGGIRSVNCEEFVLFMMWLAGAEVPRTRSLELSRWPKAKRVSFEHAPKGAIAFFEHGEGFHITIFYGENRRKEPLFLHSSRHINPFLNRDGVMVSPLPVMSSWYPGECRSLVFPETDAAHFQHIDRIFILHEHRYKTRYWE
ncbi:MAG: hypothetical protein Q8R11_04235 [bacterium]|nr:hypothetical protein [bacterium]